MIDMVHATYLIQLVFEILVRGKIEIYKVRS